MASQTLTFNESDVELSIETSDAAPVLLITGDEGQAVVAAVRNLKSHISTLDRLVWDIPGGGVVGRLVIYDDDRLLEKLFEDLTLPDPEFYYIFDAGAWTSEELHFVDKLSDALLTFNSIALLTALNAQFVPTETLWDGLILYYRLEEDAGSRLPVLGIHPLTETAAVAAIPGKNGNANNFDATGRLTDTTYNAAYDFSSANGNTFSVWFKRSSNPATVAVMGAEWLPADPNYAWGMGIDSAGHAIMVWLPVGAGSTKSVTGVTTNLGNDTWHHFVFTLNPYDFKGRLYIDGVLDNTSTAGASGQINTNGVPFNLGCGPDPAAEPGTFWGITSPTNAALDEFFVLGRCWSAAEVTEAYNSGAGKFL